MGFSLGELAAELSRSDLEGEGVAELEREEVELTELVLDTAAEAEGNPDFELETVEEELTDAEREFLSRYQESN